MIPELMESFNVSIAAIGTLSACYFYAYATAQIPVGLLIDRFGTRWLLTSACLTLAACSLIFSITNNILIANICRVLIGFGSAFAFVGCLKLGTTWFPAHKFSFIVGLTNLLGVTGAIIGGAPIAYAVETYDWRFTMLLSGITGLIITILLACIVRDKKIYNNNAEMLPKLTKALSSKQLWLIAGFGSLMVAPIAAYAELWGVSYLVNFHQIDRPVAAQITTITFIGIAFGGPSIGWFTGRMRQRKLSMLLGLLGAVVALFAILFTYNPPLWLLYFLHFCFGFFTSSMLLCFALNSEASSANTRATTIALTNMIIMATGAVLQTICGKIFDYTNFNYYSGFAPLFVCYLLAFVCYWFIKIPLTSKRT